MDCKTLQKRIINSFLSLISCLFRFENISWSAIRFLNPHLSVQISNLTAEEWIGILRIQAIPSLSFIIMGSLDWLTTIMGIFYVGAVEANPFLTDIAGTNLLAFTAIKLFTTASVGFLFYKAEKNLIQTQNRTTRSFRYMQLLIRGSYIAATTFLLVAVLNNLLVLAEVL